MGSVGLAVMIIGMGSSFAIPSSAQSVLSAVGFTGFSVTPTAHLMPWGNFGINYANNVVEGPNTGRFGTTGHNLIGAVGLLPNLEVSGRLSSSNIHENCYGVSGCGIRDLSFNFKLGADLDDAGLWSAAIGGNDFGGQVTYFRSMYGVVTYSPEKFDFSVGAARRGNNLSGGGKPLDGAFASAAYRPFEFLQAHVEKNSGNSWAGVTLFAPSDWLPAGWTAYIAANIRIQHDDAVSKNWINAGITIPLYKVPVGRAPAAKKRESANEVSRLYDDQQVNTSTLEFSRSSVSNSVEFTQQGLTSSGTAINETSISSKQELRTTMPSDPELLELAENFRNKGFEDISVGRDDKSSIVLQVNNATYNVNSLDAVGVALGVVARGLAKHNISYRFVLTQRQIKIVSVEGNSRCLADWIAEKSPKCVAGYLTTPGTGNLDEKIEGVNWVTYGLSPSWTSARIIAQPVINSAIATEYGVLDYSLAARITLQYPLWSGAYLEVGRVQALHDSENFESGRVYSADRLSSQTDKLLAHQIFRVPLEKIFGNSTRKTAVDWGASALTAHMAAGRINSIYKGLYGELRWEPFDGTSKFGLEAGRFQRTTALDYVLPRDSRPLLASYRFSYMPTRSDIKLTAGQFLYNDRGAQITFTQWFDDVSVALYLRSTKYSHENAARNFAGVELTIPLTPRKDMNPDYHIQVTGVPRWSNNIETRIGTSNLISRTQGVYPGVSILDKTFNYDRSSVLYFSENMARIRTAASK